MYRSNWELVRAGEIRTFVHNLGYLPNITVWVALKLGASLSTGPVFLSAVPIAERNDMHVHVAGITDVVIRNSSQVDEYVMVVAQ